MLEPSVNQHFQKHYPCVLAIGGHDPSSGAGVVADAQAILALKAWPLTLITSLTSQNSKTVSQVWHQEPENLLEQLTTLTSEFTPSAIKLGVLGSLELQEAITQWLKNQPRCPVVLDPVISSTSGHSFCSAEQLEHLREELLPLVSVLTPNQPELEQLAPQATTTEGRVADLFKQGCRALLLTGTHNQTQAIRNQLFTASGTLPQVSRWPRLDDEFHGSGCTLAAALAALLARGEALEVASHLAQDFTWNSLKQAVRPSEGHPLPLRLQEA